MLRSLHVYAVNIIRGVGDSDAIRTYWTHKVQTDLWKSSEKPRQLKLLSGLCVSATCPQYPVYSSKNTGANSYVQRPLSNVSAKSGTWNITFIIALEEGLWLQWTTWCCRRIMAGCNCVGYISFYSILPRFKMLLVKNTSFKNTRTHYSWKHFHDDDIVMMMNAEMYSHILYIQTHMQCIHTRIKNESIAESVCSGAVSQSPPWHHTSTDAPIHSFHSRLNVWLQINKNI